MNTLKITSFLLLALAAATELHAQDGQLDAGFVTGSGIDTYYRENALDIGAVEAIAVQSTGKIVVAGDFDHYNGQFASIIFRLHENGSLDTSFKPGNGPNGVIQTMSLQSDDKILIGGSFTQYDGKPRNYLARLNANGSLDTSFHVGTGADYYVYATAIQVDGKLLVAGIFRHFNGETKHNIVRLQTDGSVDKSFNSGIYYDPVSIRDDIRVVTLQKDGKIIVCGNLTTYDSPVIISRLNADGSMDAGFNVGNGTPSAIHAAAVQSDGKIVLAGIFQEFNRKVRKGIARINTDGSLDTTGFILPGPANYSLEVSTMCLQKTGKIIIAGRYYSVETGYKNVLIRLDAQGKADSTFLPGAVTDKIINVLVPDLNDILLLGGNFTAYNGTPAKRLARLGSSAITAMQEEISILSAVPPIFPNPNAGVFDILVDQEQMYTLQNAYGQTVQTLHLQEGINRNISLGEVESGVYYLKGNTNTGHAYKIMVVK